MTPLIIFLVSLFALLAIGVPIFMSIGLSSVIIWFAANGAIDPTILMRKMYTGLDSFPLMAIPLFMLAGELMNIGGLSSRLVKFANCILGWVHGGLGFTVSIASMFIAAILGSASASAAMIGAIMIPEMSERGYSKEFTAGLVASAGSIGPIIPPSIPFIIYGVIANVSIAKLFVAGYIPGVIMGVMFMVYTFFYAKKHKYPAERFPTAKEFAGSFAQAFLTLLLPVIIMGSILTGICTPTEAAVLAVVYAFFIGVIAYRAIKPSQFKKVFLNAARSSTMVMMVIAAAALLSWVVTLQQIPQLVGAMVLSVTKSPIVFLVIVNVFMVVVGMFLDAGSAITIITPVLLPIAVKLGVDPLLFGVIMVVNLSIGVLTPPVGLNLYVVSSIAKLDILKVSRAVVPFIIMIFAMLILASAWPGLITTLPNILIK
ncbi:MAG: TRAP transporter large permease [Sphingobacteriia bacterium]|nr:TRAP transporter large permease [Sphingobacteriia bacterium]